VPVIALITSLHTESLLDSLPSVRYYLKSYTQKQINAFATCVLYPPLRISLTLPSISSAMLRATLSSITPLDILKLLTLPDIHIVPASLSYASWLHVISPLGRSSLNSRVPWLT
jgi:hypothetical protein